MGLCISKDDSGVVNPHDAEFSDQKKRKSELLNQHNVDSSIKIHSTVTGDLDADHEASMRIPLGECTDEQLLGEVARRKIDLQDHISDDFVKKTYEFGQFLGKGASGDVISVTHKVSKKVYAMKRVLKDSTMNDAASMSTEIEILKRVRHRHLCCMYELYEAPKQLWIVLELIQGGDLCHYLASQPKYTEQCAARHMKQIFQGVHYLHSRGVVHRDLKLENILLSTDSPDADIKIADFGLSALCHFGENYDPEESTKRKGIKELTQMWGTREYFAPELIDEAYGPQADVWSIGCIFHEILIGYQAFPIMEEDTDQSFYSRIKEGRVDMTRHAWRDVSEGAKNLLLQLFKTNPLERPSASEALNDDWILGRNQPNFDKHLSFAHSYFMKKLQARENRKRADRNASRK